MRNFQSSKMLRIQCKISAIFNVNWSMFNQLIVHVQNAHYQRQLNDVSKQEVSAHTTRSASRSAPTVRGQHAGQHPGRRCCLDHRRKPRCCSKSGAASAILPHHGVGNHAGGGGRINILFSDVGIRRYYLAISGPAMPTHVQTNHNQLP